MEPALHAMPRGADYRSCYVKKTISARIPSSASTKLVHGGLRYLEHYEFSLGAQGADRTRSIVACSAASDTSLRFVMPHDKGQRPAWMIPRRLVFVRSLGTP